MNFRIKNIERDKKTLAILLLAAIGSVVAAVAVAIFYRDDTSTLLIAEIIPAAILLLSLAGLYMYFTEEFSLEDGVYFYRKPFKRSQSAHYTDIDRVTVRAIPMGGRYCQITHFVAKDIRDRPSYMIVDVVFYGKDGKKLINFSLSDNCH